MRIAITGGTGFVGRHLARHLLALGHEVVLISRGLDHRDTSLLNSPGVSITAIGLDDVDQLTAAFSGCQAVAHCAGINRELGSQTYQRVHAAGTQHVVAAARRSGVGKIALLSFLRARPDCGSGYHESKFAAEEIVRNSGLDFTVLKAGVIYGRGDHMLDHLSHALHTFPVFAFVGFRDRLMRPTAVEDMARLLAACLVDDRLSRQTVSVTGPEELTLAQAVRRVAGVVGKRPLFLRLPVAFHYLLAAVAERLMKIPLISIAQVRILSESLVEPLPACPPPPPDLAPATMFSEGQIRRGLPPAEPFGLKDCRCCGFAHCT
ncbi:MAG TPA: NAD(P)H-binding protein [Tepidisphaeraceae bacterium]|jgi:NADH dehydrogenase